MSHIKGSARCIFTHMHLQTGWYMKHIYLGLYDVLSLLLHITINLSSSNGKRSVTFFQCNYKFNLDFWLELFSSAWPKDNVTH